MARKNIVRKLQTKLHKNRWLMWAIAFSVISTFALVAYIKVTDKFLESELYASLDSDNWRTYRDNRLGFSLRYPSSWGIEAQGNTVEWTDPKRFGEDLSVSVMALSAESGIRSSLDNEREDRISVDSVSAAKIYNNVGGSVEKVVLVRRQGQLFVIRGTNPLFDRVLSLLKFNL